MAGVKEIMGKPVDMAERDRYRNVSLHAALKVRQFGQPDDPIKRLFIRTPDDAIHLETYRYAYPDGYSSVHMLLTAHHQATLCPKRTLDDPVTMDVVSREIVGGIEQWLYGDVQHHLTAGLVELFSLRERMADESPEAASLDKAIDSLRKARMLTRP